MHQILHYFKVDTSWLLNLLKSLILLKWSIFRNDYLKFYNNMDHQMADPGDK